MTQAASAEQGRWAARPVLGAGLRLLALLVPVVVGIVTALLLARVLPEPATVAGEVAWWAGVLGGSAGAVLAADRLARRLLPLAILLELSLVFPDRAPSRLRAARTSSVRDIDARLARLRAQGVEMAPYEAAETVVTLVGILGLHDKRTRGHSERVRAFTDLLTGELGLDEAARVRLRWAALVHDLGKLTIPAPVLNSTGGLDDDQWALMHRHPDEGVRLLGGLLPWLGEWGDAVGQHHERYDGTGYPNGLAGEDISYAARIVSLADSFEVMTAARSYKPSRSAAWARAELTRCAGTQFDPALVRAFLGISLGRLRWVLGPVTWLAELPFVATADRAGQTVKVASVTSLTAGLLATGALPAGPPAPELRLPPAAVAAGEPASATPPRVGVGEPEPAATSAAVAPTAARTVAPPPTTAAPSPAAAGTASRPRSASRATAAPRSAPPAAAPGPASGPTPVEAPAATAGGLPPALHLTRAGLADAPPARQEVLPVAAGETVVFDRPVSRAEVLSPRRDLVLFVRFPTRQGSAKIAVRLLDCAPQGDACRELSVGLVTQDKRSVDRYQPYVVPLDRGGPDPEQLVPGRVLRLEVTVREPGAKAPSRFALGSGDTPSRLRLPEQP